MKSPLEITREEINEMKRLRQIAFDNANGIGDGYNKNDLASLSNLSRLYVNAKTKSCIDCGGNFQEIKNSLNSFYLQHVEETNIRLDYQEGILPIEIDIIVPEFCKRCKNKIEEAPCKCPVHSSANLRKYSAITKKQYEQSLLLSGETANYLTM